MTRTPDELIQLKLRFREPTRANLEQAAKSNGVSLNSEIVGRLERSLIEDTVLGGGVTAGLMRTLATEIRRVEQRTGKHWNSDTETWTAAKILIGSRLEDFRPPFKNYLTVKEAMEERRRKQATGADLVECLKDYQITQSVDEVPGNALAPDSPPGRWMRQMARQHLGATKAARVHIADLNEGARDMGACLPAWYTEERAAIDMALAHHGLALILDFRPTRSKPPRNADGQELSEKEISEIEAILKLIVSFLDGEMDALSRILKNLEPEEEARRRGEDLARALSANSEITAVMEEAQ